MQKIILKIQGKNRKAQVEREKVQCETARCKEQGVECKVQTCPQTAADVLAGLTFCTAGSLLTQFSGQKWARCKEFVHGVMCQVPGGKWWCKEFVKGDRC